MITKRIIPCLDVKEDKVVKGVKFKNHKIVGSILDLAEKYSDDGADELVFYDISASTKGAIVNRDWVSRIAEVINIPFCVAGGIKTLEDAKEILNLGADKISINTPALVNPKLIKELSDEFGSQCVVIGMDVKIINNEAYFDLVGKNELDIIISPVQITVSHILKYIRKGTVSNVHKVKKGKAEAIELLIDDGVKNIAGKTVEDLKLNENINIPCIKRDEGILMAHGTTEILDNDHLIVFYKNKDDIEDFYNRHK